MNQSSDVNAEMQQVSAYPTKQEMHQKEVARFEEEGCGCSSQSRPDAEKEQG
jgi:hypothetical protein